jgi:hypothetical protein
MECIAVEIGYDLQHASVAVAFLALPHRALFRRFALATSLAGLVFNVLREPAQVFLAAAEPRTGLGCFPLTGFATDFDRECA